MSKETFPTTDYDSDIAANQRAPEMGSRNDPLTELANVVVSQPIFTADGNEQAGDLILLVRAPKRFKVLEHISHVQSEGIATTATLDVGDETTIDRYADGLNVAAAGSDYFTGGDDLLSNAVEADEADKYIIGELQTFATSAGADKKLKFNIYFAVDN